MYCRRQRVSVSGLPSRVLSWLNTVFDIWYHTQEIVAAFLIAFLLSYSVASCSVENVTAEKKQQGCCSRTKLDFIVVEFKCLAVSQVGTTLVHIIRFQHLLLNLQPCWKTTGEQFNITNWIAYSKWQTKF